MFLYQLHFLFYKILAVDSTLILSVLYFSDDITEANRLMTDVEPTTPQEYILKGVVNALIGQEHGIVCYNFCYLLLYSSYCTLHTCVLHMKKCHVSC